MGDSVEDFPLRERSINALKGRVAKIETFPI
jgi:hypothetical protein